MLASLVLAATTEPRDLLAGLERLRVPALLVQIMTFMVRYLEVIAGELRADADRPRVARLRGPASVAWPVLAPAAGALFIRSYERGERVHLAMLSPRVHRHAAGDPRRTATARAVARSPALLPVAAVAVTLLAGGGRRDRPCPRRRAARLSPIPTGTRRCSASTCTSQRGERVALLGPNGAGKTTLVLHLNGILDRRRGQRPRRRAAGRPRATSREVRRRVGIVFQDPDDQLFMPTVREDVAFGPANLGLRGAELERAGRRGARPRSGWSDFADRPPHHLSFGQRRRVAVATVLAMEPEILVLDEPSSNLDPASRRELADILRGLDVTVLMVTHDLPYA